MKEIFEKCFQLLNVKVQQQPGVSEAPSILDPHEPVINIISMLCKCDKKFARCIVTIPDCFQLNSKYLSKTISPQFANMPPHMIHPAHIERFGTAGAAIEHHTLLGRILRIAPSIYDPQLRNLLGQMHKSTKAAYDGNISSLRNKVNVVNRSVSDVILSILKLGGESKVAALSWLEQAIFLNEEASKDRPSPLLAASPGFLLNLNRVYLDLCQPIISDLEKLKKVQIDYLLRDDSRVILPSDSTKIVSSSAFENIVSTGSVLNGGSDIISFITQSFFMCWKALNIGYAQQCTQYYHVLRSFSHFHQGLMTDEPRAIHYLIHKICLDIQLFNPSIVPEVIKFCASASYVLYSALSSFSKNAQEIKTIFNVNSNYGTPTIRSDDSWLVLPSSLTEYQKYLLLSCPEHLVDDIMTILYTIGHTEPSYLSTITITNSLEPVLALIIFFLRRPWAISSPHLRAKFGQVLFQVFLPHSERSREDMWSNANPVDGPHTALIEGMVEAQRYLAPTLLLLYGDVEKTGFYEKLTNRRSIMIVLRYLWKLPSHRAAFRGIANIELPAIQHESLVEINSGSISGEMHVETDEINLHNNNRPDGVHNNYFIRFANGLMNETNALVATTMEKLSEIKKAQLLMKNQSEWMMLGEEGQQQLRDRLEQNEREVKGSAQLCMETLHMLNYLTSDEEIRLPFLMDEILPRFVSMLLSVLNKIVGSKSLEIKVENMESYNFEPKTILNEICQSMIHFATFSRFSQQLAQDGFYEDGATMKKAINTAEKLQLLTFQDIELLKQLYNSSLEAKSSNQVQLLNVHYMKNYNNNLLYLFLNVC